MGGHQLLLHVAGFDGSNRSTKIQDALQFTPRLVDHVTDDALNDNRPLEEIVVLEEITFEGENLLHPQRPLLIPRTRQAQCLVPRWQLDRTCPSILRERYREHFQDDPLHVVFGLGFGEAQ